RGPATARTCRMVGGGMKPPPVGCGDRWTGRKESMPRGGKGPAMTPRPGLAAATTKQPRGEQAIAANQEAAYCETVPRTSLSDHEYYSDMARRMRAKADALLEPPTDLQINAGEAITWENRVGEAA